MIFKPKKSSNNQKSTNPLQLSYFHISLFISHDSASQKRAAKRPIRHHAPSPNPLLSPFLERYRDLPFGYPSKHRRGQRTQIAWPDECSGSRNRSRPKGQINSFTRYVRRKGNKTLFSFSAPTSTSNHIMDNIRPPLTQQDTDKINLPSGISLREYLAGQAVTGICANPSFGFENGVDVQWIANAVIATTDRLISELNRTAVHIPVRMEASQIIAELSRTKQ